MTGEPLMGLCVCLDCETGKIVWQHKAYYAWSSPILLYNRDGSARLLYASCGGFMYMLDPKTGKELTKSELSNGAIEASPAAWDNYVVLGTRACKIWGLRVD
jgi:outer membrane protein assembly factor BamB